MKDGKNSPKGLCLVHPENRLIFLKLYDLLNFYRNKSTNISTAILCALNSLKCYPLPISHIDDLNKLSGIGTKFCNYIQSTINLDSNKSDDDNILDHEEFTRYRNDTLNRICEFIKRNYLKKKEYIPTRNSNAWNFLCILGLFSDVDGNEVRLTLEDIERVFPEFAKFFPGTKEMKDHTYLKFLSEKNMFNFKVIGYDEIMEDNFKYRYKYRYSYGLTPNGKRVISKLLNKVDVPLTNIKYVLTKHYELSPDKSYHKIGNNGSGIAGDEIILDSTSCSSSCCSYSSGGNAMDIEKFKYDDENPSAVQDHSSYPELRIESTRNGFPLSCSSLPSHTPPSKSRFSFSFEPNNHLNRSDSRGSSQTRELNKDNMSSVTSNNQYNRVPSCDYQKNNEHGMNDHVNHLVEVAYRTSTYNTYMKKVYNSKNYNKSINNDSNRNSNNNNEHSSPQDSVNSNDIEICDDSQLIIVDNNIPSDKISTPARVLNHNLISPSTTDAEFSSDKNLYRLSLRNRLEMKYGIDIFGTEKDYEIITVVDKREVIKKDHLGAASSFTPDYDSNIEDNAVKYNKFYDKLVKYYKENEKKVIFKQLPLGDVVWIIHIKDNNQATSENNNDLSDDNCSDGVKKSDKEKKKRKDSGKNASEEDENDYYVLNWILERKTTLDLNDSIIDGRYEEQKIRMLNLKGFNRIIYLFEDSSVDKITNKFSKFGNKALNYKAIQSAKINTKFISGFNIINTANLSHTVTMLLYIHSNIENYMYEKLRNLSIVKNIKVNEHVVKNYYSFNKFKRENRKKMTYYELFGRQLRCIPKLGNKLTVSLLTLWPTPHMFYEAINGLSLEQINDLLSTIGKTKMSKEIYKICCELFTRSSSSCLEVCSDSSGEPG